MLARHARFAVVALLCAASTATQAESILDQLPEDAIGFANVRNLKAADAKIAKVLKVFEEVAAQPLPGPLSLVKAATGLGAGINEQGDAMLALLPAEEQFDEPLPLLLVAVSDYGEFAGSINGDPTGEVCRVTIAGEEVLAAKRGAFAALMNVEHRERFEQFLASEAKPLESIAPLKKWLATVDIAAVLTPAGAELMNEFSRASLAQAQTDQLQDPRSAEQVEELRALFAFYDESLRYLGEEIEAAAVGLAIDDASNVKFQGEVILKPRGQLAKAASPAPSDNDLAGYPDEPFVWAAGGPFPQQLSDALTFVLLKLTRSFPEASGFEELAAEDWDKVRESYKLLMQGLRSISAAVLVGEKNDPVLDNVYMIMKVDDAHDYLAAVKQSMDLWNELVPKTTSDIKMFWETSEVEISESKGVLITIDVEGAANDPNVPQFQMYMHAILGDEGKLRLYFMAADEHTVIMSIADKARTEQAMKHAASNEQGLLKNAQVAKTTALLNAKAPWRALLSPPGFVAVVKRAFDAMVGQFGGPQIPAYPASPPIGWSLHIGDRRASGEIVWPDEGLKALAKYIKQVMDAFK